MHACTSPRFDPDRENNPTFAILSVPIFPQYGTGTNGSRHQLQFHAVHHPPPAVVHHQQQQYRKHQQTTHDQQLQHKAIKNSTSNQYLIDMDYMKHRMEERVTRLNDKCNEYRLNEPSEYMATVFPRVEHVLQHSFY